MIIHLETETRLIGARFRCNVSCTYRRKLARASKFRSCFRLAYAIIINMNTVNDFARGTEKLVNPMDVGTTHHLQKKLSRLPVFIQRIIITSAAKKASKMGFVVEPYAFFLFYEIDNPDKIQYLLPDGFIPAKSSVFAGDTAKYYGIASIFRLHTSAFWGARSEFYAVSRNTKTGLLSWVILDYSSDTISYDKKHGLRSPDADYSVVTTTCEGKFIGEIKSNTGHIISCEADLAHHQMRALDESLWIDGNTSIAYGKEIGGGDGGLFSLTFLPAEMKEAWEIPLRSITHEKVTWFKDVLGGKLDKAACFPFSQHMLSDSPGTKTHYGSKTSLEKAASSVDFSKLKTFSQK